MSDTKTLETASEKALWALKHYDELPSRFDPEITDIVAAAEKLILLVKAIEDESAEFYRTRFECGRIRARGM
jgi:hypothetical protein